MAQESRGSAATVDAPPHEGRDTPGRRGWILVLCSLAAFMAFLDATIVNIAFPSILSSFHGVHRSWLSWVLNGYNVAFAALLVPAGHAADRLGAKRVFIAGLLGFTAFSLGCAIAPSAAVLVALRIVQAAGAALMVPSALALLLGVYEAHKRTEAIAVLSASAAVAAAVGPSLGGLLVQASDWRLVFAVNVPLGVLGLLIAARVLGRAATRVTPDRPNVTAIVLAAAAVALIALGLTQSSQWGWGDARVLAALIGAGLLLAGLVLRSRRSPQSSGPLREPAVRLANAAILVFAAGFYAKILTDVLFLTSTWGYSAITAGLALTPGPLTTALLAKPAAKLAERHGRGLLAAIGAAVYACGCTWYALRAGVHANYVADWLPGTFLTGAGIAMAFPALTSAAVESLPPQQHGIGSAINTTARQLGGVLGVAVVIAIVGPATGAAQHSVFVQAWVYCGLAAASTAAVALMLRARAATPPSLPAT